MAKKTRVPVMKMEQLADGIFDLAVLEREMAASAKPGQFLSLYLEDKSRLLPRPVSICGIDKEKGTLRMVFRVAGEGTRQLSELKEGDSLEVMGPLGNGFYETAIRTALVIGGGIGIPPMLALAKHLQEQGVQVTAVLGYRSKPAFLLPEFETYAETVASTEDGSFGVAGNVLDAIREKKLSADMLFACGPTPMLRGIKEFSEQSGIPAQLSMEERMACGIGACLACVCRTTERDAHSAVHNRRICKDGPVFYAQEIEL